MASPGSEVSPDGTGWHRAAGRWETALRGIRMSHADRKLNEMTDAGCPTLPKWDKMEVPGVLLRMRGSRGRFNGLPGILSIDLIRNIA